MDEFKDDYQKEEQPVEIPTIVKEHDPGLRSR